MDNVLALIPARAGSKGIPGKNWRDLAGRSPVRLAVDCVWAAGIEDVYISTDYHKHGCKFLGVITESRGTKLIERPAELAQDDTPMIDVVQHALESIPGPPDQIILLTQPTQPLRTPAHLRQAIALLQENGEGSVISVVQCESIDKLLMYTDWNRGALTSCGMAVERRQDARPTFRRDGTVYAWRRGDGYLPHPWWPLIIPPEETCALDTMADWREAERRLRARDA